MARLGLLFACSLLVFVLFAPQPIVAPKPIVAPTTTYSLSTLFQSYYYMVVSINHGGYMFYAQTVDPATNKPVAFRQTFNKPGATMLTTTDFAYYSPQSRSYIYNTANSLGDVTKYKSSTLNLLPWQDCPNAVYSASTATHAQLSVAQQTRNYLTYLTTNAAQILHGGPCQKSQYSPSLTYYFTFDGNPYLTSLDTSRPIFWTNNITSAVIVQYNSYSSQAALVAAVGDVFHPFYPSAPTKSFTSPVPLMASPNSYPGYQGSIPPNITNFPYAWTYIFSCSKTLFNIQLYALQHKVDNGVGRVMFLDHTNGWGLYEASYPSAPPYSQLAAGNSVSINGYTPVQVGLWYNGTTAQIANMGVECFAIGSTPLSLATVLYFGCLTSSSSPTMEITTTGGSPSGPLCLWNAQASTTAAQIDTYINVPFQMFYLNTRDVSSLY